MRATLLLLILATLFACKKDSNGTSLPDPRGTWVGKWGDNFDTPNNNYHIVVKDNNVAEINNSFADYTGTWSIDGYTFVATYIVSAQTLTLKAPIANSHMEGVWRNVSTNQYHGTFYLDKQ